MQIAILGTGVVGQSLASGLARLGHRVTVGTRNASATLTGDFGAWASANPDVAIADFADAADAAELVINALAGHAAVVGVDAAALPDATVLLDVANPLAEEGLFVASSDSLAEQLQRAFPNLRVVKALNTMTAALMVDPGQLAGGDFSSFVCGNDADAKQLVTRLLAELGHRDVIDLGPLAAARGMEALMLLWLRLWPALGTPMFSYKIVR